VREWEGPIIAFVEAVPVCCCAASSKVSSYRALGCDAPPSSLRVQGGCWGRHPSPRSWPDRRRRHHVTWRLQGVVAVQRPGDECSM
jgi:hypothetical protein